MLLVVVVLSSPAVWSAQLFTPTLSPGNILNIHLSSISPNNTSFFSPGNILNIHPALDHLISQVFSSETYLVSLYSSATVPLKKMSIANQSSSMKFRFFSFFLLVLNLGKGKSKYCKGLQRLS